MPGLDSPDPRSRDGSTADSPSVVAASLMIQNFSNAQRDVACGPSLPRRPSAFVSVIRCLAAALGRWPARQLMTHFDSLPTAICCRAVAFACTGAMYLSIVKKDG